MILNVADSVFNRGPLGVKTHPFKMCSILLSICFDIFFLQGLFDENRVSAVERVFVLNR